jgi:hypothetical protein
MLASPKDITASLAVLAVYMIVALVGAPATVMDSLLAYPVVVRSVWLLAVLGLAYYKYYMTAVLLAVLRERIALGTTFQLEVDRELREIPDADVAERGAPLEGH